MGIPMPPNLGGGIPPPPPGLSGPSHYIPLLVAKYSKKTNDPLPPTNASLRKVFMGAINQNLLKNTFWIKQETLLFQEEEKIKIDWERVLEDFKEVAKQKGSDSQAPTKLGGEGIVDSKKINQFEIILNRFELTPEQTIEAIIGFKLTHDQASQLAMLLPDDGVYWATNQGLQPDSRMGRR
jgi:hypothetical protein